MLQHKNNAEERSTNREVAAFHNAATLFVLPSVPLAAPMSAGFVAPTTRRMASLETAKQPNSQTTIPVTTDAAAPSRLRMATRLLLLGTSFLAVTGFWWGHNPSVLAQLQAVMSSPKSIEPPVPPALSAPTIPDVASLSPVTSPIEEITLDLPQSVSSAPQRRVKPAPKHPAYSRPQVRLATRTTRTPEFRPPSVQQAQPRPQPQLTSKLQGQTKPEAILVLDIKGDIGKKGKKLKEVCDKN